MGKVRMRLWRDDASCQMIIKPMPFYTKKVFHPMYLLDGFFEIRGEHLFFEWKSAGYACMVVEVSNGSTAKVACVHRATPWTAVDGSAPPFRRILGMHDIDITKPYHHFVFQAHHIHLDFCNKSAGPETQCEHEEVAAAMQALNISHSEQGGF